MKQLVGIGKVRTMDTQVRCKEIIIVKGASDEEAPSI